MSEIYWHPEDKTWMKARKEEWRKIKYNLNLISALEPRLKRSYHKYHQEFFLYGTLNPGGKNPLIADVSKYRVTGHSAFLTMLPIFRIWYHPRPEELDLEQLRTEYINEGDNLTTAFEHFMHAGIAGSEPPDLYDSQYGLMNGREKLAFKLLFRELDCQLETILPDGRRQTFRVHPHHILHYCLSQTTHELYKDARFFPNAPGQYLWDHLSFAVEHYQKRIFCDKIWDGSKARQELLVLIAEILNFEQRTDNSHRRPSTLALVEELINKYERKDFSDAMLSLWSEAKANISKYQQIGVDKGTFYMSEERLQNAFEKEFPIKQQKERIAQWKLVW